MSNIFKLTIIAIVSFKSFEKNIIIMVYEKTGTDFRKSGYQMFVNVVSKEILSFLQI